MTSQEGPSLQSASELIEHCCLDGNVRRNIKSLHGDALSVSRRVWRLAASEMVAGDQATRLHFPTARRRNVGKLRKSDVNSLEHRVVLSSLESFRRNGPGALEFEPGFGPFTRFINRVFALTDNTFQLVLQRLLK